ncbi:unnamed protein product [Paramecium octaurelia]|uniref:TLDc domain-containing protein n=1 Tax=Paramecium octaurelia TaxID=43137 RepID=A0A8S1YJN3_PAROT|nr:unnamed protein product [Paramecium octaurelia]
MKTQSLKIAKEENVLRLTNLKQLQSSIKSFKNQIKSELGKLLQLIDQQMEQIQIEIESKESKLEIKNYNEEIQILSKNYIGNFNYNIPKQLCYKEKDLALVQLIQESIESQSKSQYFIQIMESINLIRSSEPINQQANINQIPTKEFDQHKTPCLNQICNKHNKEIIMLNINYNEPKFSRLACVECIQENPIQYVSLKEANNMWNTFIGQSEDLISKHNCRREQMFKLVIEEIKQLKDYYNHSLSEMLSSIDEQFEKNNQEIQDFLKQENKQIFELDEKSVEKMIDLLSQQDKNKHILQQQDKQDRLDQLFYQNVKSKLETLIKHDLLCKQQLMLILQEQQNNNNIGNNLQTDIKITPEINEFMSKCQLQEQYLKIFTESTNFQKELQKEASQLEQNGVLQQLIILEEQNDTEDSQCSLFQQQYKQYEINTEKMRKLIEADENEKQLLLVTKQKEELQIKIDEEKQEIKKIQEKIVELEENIKQKFLQQEQEYVQQSNEEKMQNNQLKQSLMELSHSSEIRLEQLSNKQNQLNQQMDEVQSDLKEREKSSIVSDKLESLKNTLETQLITVDQKVEKLTETIKEVDNQQSIQTQQQKEVLMSKINDEISTTNSLIENQNLKVEEYFEKNEQQLKSLSKAIAEENQVLLNDLEKQNKKQINQLEDKINNQSNLLQKVNTVVQENTKNSKKHEELLKFRFLQCRYDLYDQEDTKQFLKQLFFEQKLDQILKPKLLTDDYWIKIFYILQEKTKKTIKGSKDIFLGTRDGLTASQFWGKANNLCNLLMVFKSKSGNIFGAYSPCTWQSDKGNVGDETLSSFIFSQTHNQIYSLKDRTKAIYCKSDFGPSYGNYNDIDIRANFNDGECDLGCEYEFLRGDNYKTHLSGSVKPEIQECEIYQILFA